MRNHPSVFRPLTIVEAREYAVAGHLVIAGDDLAQGTATGHVAIVAPERQMVRSGKWRCNVPLVANVGKSNWYGKGLNWAFGRQPDLFLFTGV